MWEKGGRETSMEMMMGNPVEPRKKSSKCKKHGCKTILNMYNLGNYCSIHSISFKKE